MTVRLAVIGAGTIGSIHAQTIAATPRAELVAICDTNVGAAERLAGQLGTRAVKSLDEAIGTSPDALIIASSTASHGDVARAAIGAGVPFLCEKPLAFDLETATRISESADAGGIVAAMAFNRRFDAQYAACLLYTSPSPRDED